MRLVIMVTDIIIIYLGKRYTHRNRIQPWHNHIYLSTPIVLVPEPRYRHLPPQPQCHPSNLILYPALITIIAIHTLEEIFHQ